jgi:GH35 family endo-1,4-beta-xylanase
LVVVAAGGLLPVSGAAADATLAGLGLPVSGAAADATLAGLGLPGTIASGLLGGAAASPPPRVEPKPIPARTSTSRVPLGAAVWYACADDAYAGKPALGCQVTSPGPPRSTAYRSTWSQYFDRLTPENELKALWTEPSQGQFDFSIADKAVGLAAGSGKHVRGHTLVYPAADPAWIDKPLLPWSRNSLLAAMNNHITTVMGHFQATFPGTVDQWDVVNEPFTGTGARDQNIYQRTIGDDWIEQAFRTANTQDPSAVLFLNEFDADMPGSRHDAVLSLARDFVTRGVPIDGIGMEMHAGAGGTYPTLAGIKHAMADFAALGLRVEVTEADVLRPAMAESVPGSQQRATYDIIASACQQSPNCTGVTVWGVADAYSWRTLAQHATLFDESRIDADGLFTAKTVAGAPASTYAQVRCHLDHPWATPADPGQDPCAPVPVPSPTTAMTTGSSSGSSVDSAPAGPNPAR